MDSKHGVDGDEQKLILNHLWGGSTVNRSTVTGQPGPPRDAEVNQADRPSGKQSNEADSTRLIVKTLGRAKGNRPYSLVDVKKWCGVASVFIRRHACYKYRKFLKTSLLEFACPHCGTWCSPREWEGIHTCVTRGHGKCVWCERYLWADKKIPVWFRVMHKLYCYNKFIRRVKLTRINLSRIAGSGGGPTVDVQVPNHPQSVATTKCTEGCDTVVVPPFEQVWIDEENGTWAPPVGENPSCDFMDVGPLDLRVDRVGSSHDSPLGLREKIVKALNIQGVPLDLRVKLPYLV